MESHSLTLDEAFAFIKISKTYHRRINAVFLLPDLQVRFPIRR